MFRAWKHICVKSGPSVSIRVETSFCFCFFEEWSVGLEKGKLKHRHEGLWAWETQPCQEASSKEVVCYHISSLPNNSFLLAVPIPFLPAVLSKPLWAKSLVVLGDESLVRDGKAAGSRIDQDPLSKSGEGSTHRPRHSLVQAAEGSLQSAGLWDPPCGLWPCWRGDIHYSATLSGFSFSS